jgi:hypothetical protein
MHMAQVRRFSAFRLAAFLLIFSMAAAAQFGFPKKGNLLLQGHEVDLHEWESQQC